MAKIMPTYDAYAIVAGQVRPTPLDPKSCAVRTIYFDAQRKRTTMASFKRLVKACKALGLTDDEAKIAVLSIFDYAPKWLQEALVAKGIVTQEQVNRSAW